VSFGADHRRPIVIYPLLPKTVDGMHKLNQSIDNLDYGLSVSCVEVAGLQCGALSRALATIMKSRRLLFLCALSGL
jgi:hypothetical protein